MVPTLTPEEIEQIRNSPAAPPPPNVVPSYAHPPNNNQLAIAVIILGISVTTIVGLIRAYVKLFCTRSVRLEDFLGLLSYSLTKIPENTGYFVHLWDLRVVSLEEFLFTYLLSTTLYCVALLLAKAAILLEWSHIFVPRPNRNCLWWICYGMLTANTALYIATIAAINSLCSPHEKSWRPYLPGRCIDFDTFNIFISIFHLFFNLLMLILPHSVIWKLSLTTKQKTGVSVMFSVGILGCAWAAGRVISAFGLSKTQDKTYAYSQYIMWGIAEVATAELIFCVPAFPLAFRPPSPLHSLFSVVQSKVTMIMDLERVQSSTTLPELLNDRSHQDAYGYRRTWQDNGCDTSLTELDPVRIRGSCQKGSHHDIPKITLGGILVTTEIEVRSDAERGSKTGRGEPSIDQSER
ncbi:hypothetical protein F5Y03DRAFT_405725 [Xylaria venustula]|nr:hypothetical protein F5Y03DRAFT_405725 [Xylaria venustula]